MHALGLGISGFEHNPYSSVSSGCHTPYWELGGGGGLGLLERVLWVCVGQASICTLC